MAMNFAEIQAKKMMDMQEAVEAQPTLPMINNQINENSIPS
jgi:hypothetical protein